MARAYAPYSGYPVGAAGLTDDGRIVVGCNVENASYGVGLCAECGLVSALHGTGGGRLVAVSVVERRGEPVMPCGRCRQLLWEHGGAGSAPGDGTRRAADERGAAGRVRPRRPGEVTMSERIENTVRQAAPPAKEAA